ncbi:MAG: metal ABC transporter ATP-binding protein [Candidatus Kerfeldbacteria bacterium]|nr:metal ABC transporter ATP-binding protein [Candidatus Kerfeldbacteria bacterium]
MSSSTTIDVRDLSVAFHDKVVVDHVSFSITRGEFVVIIGPNGSGKTTLVRAMLGLLPAASGGVSFFGKRIDDFYGRVAYVPQRFSFDTTFPITVREFLHSSLWKSRSHSECDRSITEHLGYVGMSEHGRQLIGNLSGGQLQRVLIARSLLAEPEVLVLDEPVAGIDIGGEQVAYELIHSIQQSHHLTVIMISHEPDLLSNYATSIVCLNKRLLCHGKPRDVLTPETFKQMYGERVGLFSHKH